MDDGFYMQKALGLAHQAEGFTSPNPMVGCVIVKDDQIVGQGYHQRAGTAHAEVHALREAGEYSQGATLYVTLEPCSHYGRTPPCAKAIIEANVTRVVAAMTDPNPLVSGKGLDMLRQAGIQVKVGLMEVQARKLNEVFIKWITTHRPFVVMKTASSLDGKIATHAGHSKWITGEQARQFVHCLRRRYDAIMVGVGTVLADDPLLTVRLPDGNDKQPVRVIIDSQGRTPLQSKILSDLSAKTMLMTTKRIDPLKLSQIEQTGVEVHVVDCDRNGQVDIRAVLAVLADRQLTSVLVEGGGTLNWSIIRDQLADKGYAFIAPKIIAGAAAPGAFGGQGFAAMDQVMPLQIEEIRHIGDDLLVEYYLKKDEQHCLLD